MGNNGVKKVLGAWEKFRREKIKVPGWGSGEQKRPSGLRKKKNREGTPPEWDVSGVNHKNRKFGGKHRGTYQ